MTKYESMVDRHGESWSYVPETRFGQWFLRTNIWTVHVLKRAINDLDRVLENRQSSYPVIVDVGCGWGRSFRLLAEKFNPQKMIGIEIDPKMARASRLETRELSTPVEIIECSNSKIDLPDDCADIAFCHQTFHHLLDHESALNEYFRILKPGGLLLFAESTKRYIHSYLVRYLFAHPMDIQMTSNQYLKSIRSAGFVIYDNEISYPYLWWSREDLGIGERWFRIPPRMEREQTLVNLIARKPA